MSTGTVIFRSPMFGVQSKLWLTKGPFGTCTAKLCMVGSSSNPVTAGISRPMWKRFTPETGSFLRNTRSRI